ncbi:MAG: 2-C-methyl-D-erythritol 2,4-cyclodiphosphate synthase [Acidobacteriota bacterium]|nr:2-C-methyl-D-erythritol 2,4-cyclodiphosphate synthase [Acidobacteriota bacterium]
MRIGQGFDIHPFTDSPDRRLILAGVELPGPGLAGHSDADVVAHAVADALLGAAGLGDIGTHFPDSDPSLAGVDSMDLLSRVVAQVTTSYRVANVDVTVILETPKVAPYRLRMEERLSQVLDAPASVKAKRGEGLGAIGRAEGVACLAVALLVVR